MIKFKPKNWKKKKIEEEEAYPLSPRIMTFNNMRRREAIENQNQNLDEKRKK
jgi:hypothetical protein